MLKSYDWWWRILVSAQGPLVLGLGLRVWGQGLTIQDQHSETPARAVHFIVSRFEEEGTLSSPLVNLPRT